jgi:DNA repair protein RadA/Sms
VLDRIARIPLARAELYGATVGGARFDDPACDLAIAAALASAATGVRPPPDTAFVGEVALTGAVRPVSGLEARVAAAAACGIRWVVAAAGRECRLPANVQLRTVEHVSEAVAWASER